MHSLLVKFGTLMEYITGMCACALDKMTPNMATIDHRDFLSTLACFKINNYLMVIIN